MKTLAIVLRLVVVVSYIAVICAKAEGAIILGNVCLGTTEFVVYDDMKTGFEFSEFCSAIGGDSTRASDKAERVFLREFVFSLGRNTTEFLISFNNSEVNSPSFTSSISLLANLAEDSNSSVAVGPFSRKTHQSRPLKDSCAVWLLDDKSWTQKPCNQSYRYVCRVDGSSTCQSRFPAQAPTTLPPFSTTSFQASTPTSASLVSSAVAFELFVISTEVFISIAASLVALIILLSCRLHCVKKRLKAQREIFNEHIVRLPDRSSNPQGKITLESFYFKA